MWKIQNRKRAQKKRKMGAKNRKRAQFEKVFELIIHFRVSRVFFSTPRHFLKKRPFWLFLRICCAFFAFFLPRDAAVRCVKACQCMTEPCQKNKNPAVFNLSPSTYAVSSMDCSSSRARKKAVHAGPGFAWSKMGPEPKQ